MNRAILEPQHDIETKLGNVSLHRSNLYQLLSKSVQYPVIELAESLLEGTFYSNIEESIHWVNAKDRMYDSALEKLKKVSENKAGYSPEELLKGMEEEYQRLFMTKEQALVSLFERDYIDKSKTLNIVSIEKAYHGVQSDVLVDYHQFPDHIATELSYLSFLGQQEGESWFQGEMEAAKNWKVKERTFIVHHLRKWGISFFVNMERTTKLEAYEGIASVGKVFMTLEHGN